MCSSPKNTARRHRQSTHSAFSQLDHEEYARMIQRASECYERAQLRKTQKKRQNNQPPDAINHVKQCSAPDILAAIKGFFVRPVFSGKQSRIQFQKNSLWIRNL